MTFLWLALMSPTSKRFMVDGVKIEACFKAHLLLKKGQ